MKRSDSDENLAELDQFVAQLRAKRQFQQQYHQQQYMAECEQLNEEESVKIGPKIPVNYNSSNTQPYVDKEDDQQQTYSIEDVPMAQSPFNEVVDDINTGAIAEPST